MGEIAVNPRPDDPPGPAELRIARCLPPGAALRNLRLTRELETLPHLARDGKVAREHLYFDQLEFLQQIEALPPAGQ